MSGRADDVPRLAVLLGRADDMRAVVYVRLLPHAAAAPAGLTHLSGTLRGPRCRHATTLATTATLKMLPPLEGGQAGPPTCEAVLVEPGFWSPELPNRYQLDLDVADANGGVSHVSQWVGVCRLGHRDGGFRLDGRRYVPRVVRLPEAAVASPQPATEEARAASVAVWAALPTTDVCEAADAEGVMLVVDLPETMPADEATRECARLARHPSVGFLVVGADLVPAIADWRGVRGTTQVGLRVNGQLPPPGHAEAAAPPQGVDFLVATLPSGGLPHTAWRLPPPLPVIVRRPLPADASGLTMREQRRGCDQLQAEVAGWLAADGTPAWEPAGYDV